MTVLLISMPVPEDIEKDGMHIMPPMALYLLGAILQEHGHTVKIIDPAVIRNKYKPYMGNRRFIDFIRKSMNGIDVVGISGNTINWKTNKYLIQIIRKFNQTVKIVLGGLHVSYFYEYTMRTNDIDFIIRDEGEVALPALLDALSNNENYENIAGLVYKKDGKIYTNEPVVLTKDQLQQSPLPIYDQMPNKEYPMMPIMTSRGCKFACRFCSVPRKHNWIGLDEGYVIRYVKAVTDKYIEKFLTNCIYFTDDCFTADGDRACKILDGIEPLDINVSVEARARDLRNIELLKRLQHPQVQRIAIGVECGYNEGLKKINKGLTVEDVIEVLELLKKYGLIKKAWCSFIYGFPWETVADCEKTIDFAAHIVNEYGVQVNMNMLSLFPSQIWSERKNYNIKVEEDHFDNETLASEKGFFATHPNLSYSDVNYLLKRVLDYEARDIMLRSR